MLEELSHGERRHVVEGRDRRPDSMESEGNMTELENGELTCRIKLGHNGRVRAGRDLSSDEKARDAS